MLQNVVPSRRNFLVGLGKFAAVAPLVPSLPWAATALAATPRDACPPPSAWKDLAAQVSGGVLTPLDPFFGDVCRPNNLRYGTLPMGIARCLKTEDVQAAIRWVKQQGLPFRVRSGGHNYAGYSATNGLLIDMSLMAGVEVLDKKNGIVRVKGGTINSLVYKELERLGRTITHGRCDAVGAAGFLLGGGIGFNMRRYGVASDLLRSTSLVTADGERHEADDKQDSGLYWACRGGAGGNFGINTDFTLQTFPVDTVSVCQLTWTKDQAGVVYDLLQRLPAAPDSFGSKINITLPSIQQRCQGVGSNVSILAQLHKTKGTSLKQIFGPLWERADKRTVHEDIPYWVAQDFLSEETFPYYYQEKSSYMHSARITRAAVDAMFEAAKAMPGTSMPVAFKFFQTGGVINDVKPDATAYVHRGYDWLFSVEMNWWQTSDPQGLIDENLAWQKDFYALANKTCSAIGAYQNFPDPTLDDWAGAYYGANYTRLREVKKQVDPDSFFNYGQGIKPI
ncbi:FAD-binding oxidoreductase [Niveispirillum sp. KHB5.9]|uniref:FAD-binding oxidoreductase n=1 Tax=Niveispirillum sp. KHB5.9 TaxID=3400269 RepID=UPI003A85FFE0